MHELIRILFLVLLTSCAGNQRRTPVLPIFGEIKVNPVIHNGKQSIDTVYHTIGPFAFLNQFNDTVDDNTLKHKVFIISCFHSTFQTKTDTLLEVTLDSVHRILGNEPDFYIISQTIDPAFDTPDILRKYCENKNITGKNRYYLTGQSADSIYRFLRYKYFLLAERDTTNMENGGFIHSDKIVLIDRQQRIRGYYDGTDIKHVGQLINDAKTLLQEDTL